MRRLLWILTGCGALYVVSRFRGRVADLTSALEAVSREVDSLEQEVRELKGRNRPSVVG